MFGFSGTREWVYPLAVDGRYQRLRRWTFLALHLVLFVTPWVLIQGHPALLFDLEARRLYAFGAIFTAADTILLLLMLLFLAFALFFFTSLYGRLWCGYACPQTVFLDAWIRPLERWIEGDRAQRRRRDEIGWSFDRVWRKAAKWSLFALVSFVTAMAFMSFFAGARELWTGRAGPVEYALVGIFTVGWFLDFAWFREQFCNYLCPYARFQSALTDEDTLQISYDARRGEPRGDAAARAEGRCTACNRCVAVCPAGIDIRDGFQLECIACARCVDACEDVMGNLGHASLVRYSTLAADQGGATRRLHPRTVVYAGLLTGIAAAWAALLLTRAPFEAGVSRAPGSLFTVDADGEVRNTYLLRITNNDPVPEPIPFSIKVEGLPGAEVVAQDVRLGTTESRTLPLVIRIRPTAALPRTVPIKVRITSPRSEMLLDATFKSGGTVVTAN
ncbi:MAG TPA: cytochrome c oxidase accessory protein CcoG [Gemmatimonadales bacterium]|nr:cytochrome c oxidase accessory protein CcoG [Gemmatimonadales bacterium]